MEPGMITGPVATAGGLTISEAEEYYYFCLKNGARKTVFRVNKKDVDTPDIDTYIKKISAIYPEYTEIYPITKEEHDIIRKNQLQIRRIFNKARKRSVIIVNDGVMNDSINTITNTINDILG